jgi:hypothetical protein
LTARRREAAGREANMARSPIPEAAGAALFSINETVLL